MTAVSATGTSSAKSAGFRVPLESDLHELTFMQWPSNAAPFGGADEMVKDLKAKVFPDQDVRFLAAAPGGEKQVRVV